MGWNLFSRLFEGDVANFQDLEDIYNTIMSLFCVLAAGFAAGLTMGLLSLDPTKMQMKAMTGSPWEKDAAMRIIPVIKQHHLLLVTLLLANSLANEALPVFLGALVPNYVAVIISVSLVLIFGEILPSAIFTGPNQLYMANKMVPLVRLVMTVLWPIAYPISRILDYFFGEEETSTVFSRNDFEALIQLQTMHNCSRNDSSVNRRLSSASSTAVNATKGGRGGDDTDYIDGLSEASSSPGTHADANYGTISTTPQKEFLSSDEVKIMSGILNLSRQTVLDAMIPISNAFMISDKTKLGIHELQEILSSGFSRIPVYEKNDRRNILGFILVKQLVVLSPSDNVGVDSLDIREPIILRPNVTLLEALSIFRKGQKTVQTKRPKSPSVGSVNKNNNNSNDNSNSNNNDSVHHSHIALISKDPMRALSMMRSFRLMNAEKKKGSFLTADYVRGIIDSDEESAILGIVTLEDVIEKIIQEDIIDETDVIADKSNKPAVGSSLAIHKKFTNSKGSKRSTFGSSNSRSSARLHSDSIDSNDSEVGLSSVSGSKLPGLGRQNNRIIMNDSIKNVENGGGSHFSPYSNISSNYNSNNNCSNSNNNSNLSFASALNDSGGAMWFDDGDDGSDDFLSDGNGNDEENAAATFAALTTPPSRRRRQSVNRGGDKFEGEEVAGGGSSEQQRRRGGVKGHHNTLLSPRSGNSGSGCEEDFLNESTCLLLNAVDE